MSLLLLYLALKLLLVCELWGRITIWWILRLLHNLFSLLTLLHIFRLIVGAVSCGESTLSSPHTLLFWSLFVDLLLLYQFDLLLFTDFRRFVLLCCFLRLWLFWRYRSLYAQSCETRDGREWNVEPLFKLVLHTILQLLLPLTLFQIQIKRKFSSIGERGEEWGLEEFVRSCETVFEGQSNLIVFLFGLFKISSSHLFFGLDLGDDFKANPAVFV